MRFLTPVCIILFSIVSHAQKETLTIAKEQPHVDFTEAKVDILITPKTQTVAGEVTYIFNVLKSIDTVFVDAQKMNINKVVLEENKIDFIYDSKKIGIISDFKPNTRYSVTIAYDATPKKALYFVKDIEGNDQVWTQGQGKYTSNWLPSFDDMNEKVAFDLAISYYKNFEVIANGTLEKVVPINDSIQKWQYDMQQPMSSYLVAFAIGKYDKVADVSSSGTPLEMYYYPKDKDKFEFTYKHSKKIFDFLEEEIGFDYPWQNYKQIPVKDFLYAGMENTGTTIFSDSFIVDETGFVDQNYINVNAHELAHQWFGDLVTATEGKHHWLQEGFATYYALLAEKEIFGEDYFLFKLYESAEQLTELSKTDNATSLLDPKASSLTFYQRGAWALHALRNLIGDASFKISVHNYLEKHKFKNVTTNDFIAVASSVSGMDLSDYKKLWLDNVKFPSQEALDILTQSKFIKDYLNLAKERTQPIAGKWKELSEALSFPVNDYIGQEAVYQLSGNRDPEVIALYDKAFETNNVFVRQAIANTLSTVPKDLQEQYESLLKDASYATIEPAIYHLWSSFPQKRKEYLDTTKEIIGFNNKNIRTLWLVLALSTQGYQTDQHQKYYQELSSYTSPKYSFNVRQNAFTYLESLQAFSDQSLQHLAEGAVHHNWRFRSFCRKLVDAVLKNEEYKKKYVALWERLPKNQQDFLKKKLTP
ncbi:M1 family metallopeptidase [Aquimarina sp. 2201CG1-2-11]|uniref:M1 family metallopeptidase n=1 Tax=Aquimarina discodermiae TaxID=3231043 RepID=UPI0034631B43